MPGMQRLTRQEKRETTRHSAIQVFELQPSIPASEEKVTGVQEALDRVR